MTELLYGCDVSHFQSTSAPGGIAWPILAKGCQFVIVRATYGTWKDPSAIGHIARARDAGMQVGLYHFFRSSQPVADQLTAFCAAAHDVGMRSGDICPALDVEDDGAKGPKIDPSWQDGVRAMLNGLVDSFGEALCYITQRDFGRLGKPAFVLNRPLWVAHYTSTSAPATPGNKPWAIWQHRVGPFVPDGPGGAVNPMVIDQDRAIDPLPIASKVPGEYPSVVPGGKPPEEPHEVTWQARLDALTNGALASLDLRADHDAPEYS
jgi:hypothetical protein